jgi:hypothetical protein
MKSKFLLSFLLVASLTSVFSESTNVAEDDAGQYGSGFDNGKNGGTGFGPWTMMTEGNDENRHAGFYVADTEHNPDLNGIVKDNKAFGLYANGSGFEQAVAYRPFEKPLAEGDSFSFMMENGVFEKKFDKDDPTPGSIGLVLRNGNINTSPADYNNGSLFEFGYYQGKGNYQIYDGTPSTDSGVPFSDFGVSVTVTLISSDSYDLEIVNLKDKKITKLPGRKLSSNKPIESFAIFDRNSEKYDAYFNQFQVARDAK